MRNQPSVITFKSIIRRACTEFAGIVPADTVAHAHTRHNLPKNSVPLPPYSEGETSRLIAVCKQAVGEIDERLALGRELLAHGRRPSSAEEWKADENLLWLLNHYGPGARREMCKAEGYDSRVLDEQMRTRRKRASGRSWKELCGLLWPGCIDLIPYLLLLGLQAGISPEGVTSLRVDSVEMLGDGKVRMRWLKARGGGLEADTFSSRGRWSTGALINRVIAATEPLRNHAVDPSTLWLAATKEGMAALDGQGMWAWALRDFASVRQLLDDQGGPLQIDRRRLRKTYYARLDRRYHGAVNIIAGANQSAQVAADHYLAATTATSQIVDAVEQTQHMLLARAEASRRVTVLTEERVRELAADPAGAAAALQLPMFEAERVLTTTESDVFAAKCKDFHNSPHGAPGQPCPAAVWECLFCPLAIVTPTKLPNLLHLLDHIDAQSRQLELGEWQRRYLAARRAIKEQILPQFDPAVIDAARARSAEATVYLPPEEVFE